LCQQRPLLTADRRLPTANCWLLAEDERGSVAVQTLLLVPVLALVVFGGYAIFGAMEAKQALHHGTYQAVRYLALNPPRHGDVAAWHDVAERLIRAELEAQVGPERARFLDVEVQRPQLAGCGQSFVVEAELRWTFDVPFADFPAIRLRKQYQGVIEC
jgi:hypothetical protein